MRFTCNQNVVHVDTFVGTQQRKQSFCSTPAINKGKNVTKVIVLYRWCCTALGQKIQCVETVIDSVRAIFTFADLEEEEKKKAVPAHFFSMLFFDMLSAVCSYTVPIVDSILSFV